MRALLGRFRHSRKGGTGVEFALVAPLFLALVFSIFETGWLMTQTVMLERALDRTVRHLRVGGSDAPRTYAAFTSAVCADAMVVPNCAKRIRVEMHVVRSAADFPAQGSQCENSGQPSYSDNRSDVMFVRACVPVDPMTPGIGIALSLPRDAGGRFRVVAATSYMNEPG